VALLCPGVRVSQQRQGMTEAGSEVSCCAECFDGLRKTSQASISKSDKKKVSIAKMLVQTVGMFYGFQGRPYLCVSGDIGSCRKGLKNEFRNGTGQTIDFLLTAKHDADAAKRFFRKTLLDPANPQRRVINVEQEPSVSHGRGGTQGRRHSPAPLPTTLSANT